jgi:Domain of unknown function (DUF1996)
MKRLSLSAVVITLLAFATTQASAPKARASARGWEVFCGYSHSLPDDPIVFPKQPGASHLHDFIGNKTVNAGSTYATMTAGATTCALAKDTAGYWTPALYRHGVRVRPNDDPPPNGTWRNYHSRQQVYYVSLVPGRVHTIPKNLRIVAGNGHATSAAQNPLLGREIYWGCADNVPDVKAKAPINCATGIISLHVGFPQCWDGLNTDTIKNGRPTVNPYTNAPYRNDHFSHMAYPVSKGGDYMCPANHPVAIPRVIMRWEYPIGTLSSGIRLSSGATYTVHGDFWNTWNQRKLNNLVTNCINAHRRGCKAYRHNPK